MLEKLNTLRNTFAHSLSATISKKDILDLYNCLSEPLREGLKVTHKAIGRGDLSEPSSLEPRDLLILIFLNVRQAIKAAVVARRLAERGGSDPTATAGPRRRNAPPPE